MGKRGLHSFTNPATLEAFDDVSLWAILHQHRLYCAEHGLALADQPQEDLDRHQVAKLLQADADLPRQLLDAFLTIGDVAVPSRLPELVRLGQQLGLAPEDILGDDITPVMVAARIWRKDAAALKRLAEQAQIEAGHAYRTWRADADEVPTYTPIREADLRRWEQHIAGEFHNRGLGDGARIFVHSIDDYIFFLVRHGCSPRREVTHVRGADTSNVVFRPSRTDILRYDTLTGDLAIYQRERRKWQEELYLTSCSLHAFGRPHLFTSGDAYDLGPVRAHGPRPPMRWHRGDPQDHAGGHERQFAQQQALGDPLHRDRSLRSPALGRDRLAGSATLRGGDLLGPLRDRAGPQGLCASAECGPLRAARRRGPGAAVAAAAWDQEGPGARR